MSGEGARLTIEDVTQFDSRVQLAVLAATARVYAAGLEASGDPERHARHEDARHAVDDYLDHIAPLVLGASRTD